MKLITATRASKPTLGFDSAEQPLMADVSVKAALTLPDGTTSLKIDRVNKPRRSGDLVLYTRRWGASTHTTAGGTEVVLKAAGLPLRVSGSWTASVVSVAPKGRDTAIPAGSLVLSAKGSDAAALAGLEKGSTVTITTTITPGWEGVAEAIGGREWLVEASHTSIRPVSAITTNEHPRTAVALRPDGHLVLVTVDGRWDGYSVGVTAADLAGLLVDQGAEKAIMLDGGSSTTALVRRPGGIEVSLANRPSAGRELRVDDALFVISSAPTGPRSGIVVAPGSAHVMVGETVAFHAGGVDAALNGVSISGAPVTWSMSGGAGTLDGAGRFRATTPGEVTVTATMGEDSASAVVDVVPDTSAPVALRPVTRLQHTTVGADSVPVAISWPAATDIGTGVAAYELRRQLDGAGWVDVALPTPTTRTVSQLLPTSRAVQYEVRATDNAGNTGAWRTGATFYLRVPSEHSSAVRYTGNVGHPPLVRIPRRCRQVVARGRREGQLHLHRQPGGVDRGTRAVARNGARLPRRPEGGDRPAPRSDPAPAPGRVQPCVDEGGHAPDHRPSVRDRGPPARGRGRVRGGRYGERLPRPRGRRRRRLLHLVGRFGDRRADRADPRHGLHGR